jgi:hypothetical protein
MKMKTSLRDIYSFPGFRARATLKPHHDDHEGFIVKLERRQKKQSVQDAVSHHPVSVIAELAWYEIRVPGQPVFILSSSTVGSPAGIVKP